MQKSDDLSLKTTAAKKVKVWIDSYLSFIINTTKSIDVDKKSKYFSDITFEMFCDLHIFPYLSIYFVL